MLVLSRKQGEKITVGDEDCPIVIEVIEIRGKHVRLGFKARRDVPIYRSEILGTEEKIDGTRSK
jgi:carbon storage regulator CsrA